MSPPVPDDGPPRTLREKLASVRVHLLVAAFGLPFVLGFLARLLKEASWWSLITIVAAWGLLWSSVFFDERRWPRMVEVLVGAGHGLLWFHWSYRTKQLADFSFQSAGPVLRWGKAGLEAAIRTGAESMMLLVPIVLACFLRFFAWELEKKALVRMRARR